MLGRLALLLILGSSACAKFSEDRAALDAAAPDDGAPPIDAGGGPDAAVEDAPIAPTVPVRCLQSFSTKAATTAAISVDLPLPVLAGSSVVVAVLVSGPSPNELVVTGTQNTKYVRRTTVTSGSLHGFVLAADNLPGGPERVTANLVGVSASTLILYVHEYSGLAMSSYETANGNTANCGTPDCLRTATMMAPAGALVFGFAFGESSAVRHGSDFTLRESNDENVTEDHIMTKAGPVVVTASPDSPSSGGVLGLVLRAR